MRGFAATLDRISHTVDRVCRVASALFFIAMITLVMIQVIARYGFSAPPEWTEEAARYCMIWLGLLGATVAYRAKKDPVLIHVPEEWPPMLKTAARAGRSLATFLFLTPFVYYGMEFLVRYSHRTTDTIGVNAALVVAIVPIFSVIVMLHAIADLVHPQSPQTDEFETTETGEPAA